MALFQEAGCKCTVWSRVARRRPFRTAELQHFELQNATKTIQNPRPEVPPVFSTKLETIIEFLGDSMSASVNSIHRSVVRTVESRRSIQTVNEFREGQISDKGQKRWHFGVSERGSFSEILLRKMVV